MLTAIPLNQITMLFNSFEFLIFFPLVTLLYFLLPHRFRWLWLLASSCYFYMAFVPIYILILGFTIVVDYFAGIWIENAKGRKRKLFLVFSLIANIGVLAVFKYYNFINENISILCQSLGVVNNIPYLSILLPIGLSFHTFQAMSYTIEVYRGNQKAEKHFGIYSLYVMFYPQLVAGPIERPQNVLHQFHEYHKFDYTKFIEGCKLLLWGFFMKVVVADRLSIYVDAVYNNPADHNGSSLLVATFFFAIQIYCDFAGYSTIALGCAKVMGFDLMQNFRRPYLATSPAAFWKRWHISLSTWFQDYLYIPLGGSRVSIPRNCFNLFLTFMVSGLWHGASWTFIIWGALNGLYMVTERLINEARKKGGFISRIKVPRLVASVITFLLISFAWIFFRANSMHDALLIVKKIFTTSGKPYLSDPSQLLFSLTGIAILFLYDWQNEFFVNKNILINNKNVVIRNVTYATIILLILLIGVFDGGQFIYFQF